MRENDGNLLGGTVEIDETYVGGRVKGKGQAEAMRRKSVVMGAVQRGGELRLRHVENAEAQTLRGFIAAHVSPDTGGGSELGVYHHRYSQTHKFP
jgi:transposase-like protein